MILPVDITALKDDICRDLTLDKWDKRIVLTLIDRNTKKSQGVYLQKPRGIPAHIQQALNEGDGVYRP